MWWTVAGLLVGGEYEVYVSAVLDTSKCLLVLINLNLSVMSNDPISFAF